MWQSSIEIKHYSASVKNEFTALIKVLRLPLHHVQVSVIFIASMSSYAHELKCFHLDTLHTVP